MNYKQRLLLWYVKKGNTSWYTSPHLDISYERKKREKAARMAQIIFDKKIHLHSIINTSAEKTPLRIYRPSEKENLKVILFIHGGGFVFYGLNAYDYVCRRLSVMNQAVVVSVDYRLAPENPYPAAHKDCLSALKWVTENIWKYGGSAEKIIVMGDSAGGNLAAFLAHESRKKKHPHVRAQILSYPFLDSTFSNPSIKKYGKGFFLDEEVLHWYRKQYTPKPEDWLNPDLFPARHTSFYGLAPALIQIAGLDPLADEAKYYGHLLIENGINCEIKVYPNNLHGFLVMPGISSEAKQAYRDIQSFCNLVCE